MTQFTVNGEAVDFRGDPDTPLLWVLRDSMGLTGTKFGCGRAQCGACTVHVNGEAELSCSVKVADVAGKRVNTIEGLAATNPVSRGPAGCTQTTSSPSAHTTIMAARSARSNAS